MARTTYCLGFLCGLLVAGQSRAQEVMIMREPKPQYPKAEAVAPVVQIAKAIAVQAPKLPAAATPPSSVRPTIATTQNPAASQTIKTPATEPAKPATIAQNAPAPKTESTTKPAVSQPPKQNNGTSIPVSTQPSPLTKPAKSQLAVTNSASSPSPSITSAKKDDATAFRSAKIDNSSSRSGARLVSDAAAPQPISFSGDSAFVRLADGFDFPVGKPDAQGYYKARGFRSRGHLGEDWDGVGGGDTDLGDPIYSIGTGVVVFARDCHMGWGNVVIVRHSYRDGGSIKNIDALYGHLNNILVHRGQAVARGQKIATMGNAHGLYDAHLHLEIRKNVEIGMSRAAFARDFSNYYDPSQFIASHRHLQTNGGTYRVALNTFTHDTRINWDKARNYSHAHSGGGSGESAAALKRAVAAQH